MTKPLALPPGMVPTRRYALRVAETLGCTVSTVARTGEVRVHAPDGRRVTLNNRRKDASRALLVLLRDLQARPGQT